MNPSKVVESILLVIATFAVLAAIFLLWSPHQQRPATGEDSPNLNGLDTLIVLIVSPTCRACTQEPGLPVLKEHVKQLATSETRSLRLIGASVDADLDRGKDFLEELSGLDEIYAGGGWTNWIAMDLIWSDDTALSGIPQMVVVERMLETDERIRLVRSEVISRAFGLDAINQALGDLQGG